jgi:hypothetical protein
MLTRRWHWQMAAGLLLTAAGGGVAVAQEPPRIDLVSDVEVLPTPRNPVPLAPPVAPGMAQPAEGTCMGGCSGWGGHGWFSWWPAWKEHVQHAFLGEPKEWQYPPLGHWVYVGNRTQVSNGEAARMVLYNFDFCDGGDTLNVRGKDKLAQIAAMMCRNPYPLVIERTPYDIRLGEARRVAVLNELAQCGLPIPRERVVVAAPIANGLNSLEAPIIGSNLLRQTTQQGATFGMGITGGFSTGGLSGGGTGGGGAGVGGTTGGR